MRVLFLTNNPATQPLADWLQERVSDLQLVSEPLTVDMARSADLVVSYAYRHILRADVLAVSRFINLHVSYLPFNRGADPNAWSHLEGTPSGVTIHEIDAGVDTGPILLQRQVMFSDNDTLGGSYSALQDEIQDLFRENWPAIEANAITPIPQQGEGSHHYVREFAAVKDRLLGSEGWGVSIGTLKARWRELVPA